MTQGIQTKADNNLEEWDREGDGRELQREGDVCIHPSIHVWLIHVEV